MKLSVPLPGDFDSLKKIVKNAPEDVCEVYMAGSAEFMGSGRATLHSPFLGDIKKQIDYVHRKNIQMNLILNSSCIGGQHLTFGGYNMIRGYLSQLNNLGLDSITVSEPYLVEMISKDFPKIRVGVSCIAHTDSPQKAQFFEKLGAEDITLDTNINRHFDLIEAIRESTDCKLKIIANEACIYKCPFRYSHFNLFSHATGPPPKPEIFGDYYFEKCISLRVRNPELIIRSPWVRPEDMEVYEKIGINILKISGRANTTNWIIDVIKHYGEGKYQGNLLEILDCPNELRDLFYIPNEKLEGAIHQWMNCSKLCHRCNFCKDLAKKSLKEV